MSRIAKNPVTVPEGVEVKLNGQDVTVKGKQGTLSLTLVEEVKASFEEGKIIVSQNADTAFARAMWGTSRSLVNNLVVGVSEGFSKRLEINGVGYRAAVQGKELVMQLGYSHEIRFAIPEGITIKAEKPTLLDISGVDKQKVGQVAAKIISYRPPEPYKGKGIKYEGQQILRKEGKKK